MIYRTVRTHALHLVILSISIAALSICLLQLHHPASITIRTNAACISLALLHELHTIITPALLIQYSSASLLLRHLQHHMPSIEKIQIRYDRPYHATVTLEHAIPIACINDNIVLTTQGKFIPCTQYTLVATQHLPHLTIQEELTPSTGNLLHTMLQTMPCELLELYTLVWRNKTEILLYPHAALPYRIICWHNSVFTPDLLHALERMALVIEQRSKKNHHMHWQIDLRQPHYLMVTPLAKGKI